MAAILTAAPYVAFAFSVGMGGMAAASLVKSPEERHDRESFLYNYGAFIGYAVLSVIGLLVLLHLYQSGALGGMVTKSLLGVGFSDLGGPYAGYLAAQATTEPLLKTMRNGLFGPPVAPNSRRQVGHGRYHT